MSETKSESVSSMERAVSVEFIKASGGFAVKALPNQKEPAKGWDPKLNTEARSAQLLNEIEFSNDNLGVHFHGDLVDVDVDGENAEMFLIPALDAFLPACSHVWGRKSRPRTHRAYLLKSMESFDPSAFPVLTRIKRIPEVKVEMRGGPITRGEYSLLPSSIHPSGELYEWHDIGRARSTPAVARPEDIMRGIRKAGACAVLGPYWGEGVRQELTMALAGFMHRAQSIAQSISEEMFHVGFDEALAMLEVLLKLTGDDTKDIYARKKAFEATWKKAEKGKAVTGATTIAEITGDVGIVSKLYTLLTENPEMAALDEFTNRFAIWQGPALVVDLEAVGKGSFKPFMSRQNFASSFGHKFVTIGEKRKLLPEMLWHMASTVRVQGMTFEPNKPRVVKTYEGEKVNQWAGFKTQKHPSPVTDNDIKPFLDYLFRVVANQNQEHYEWVLNWVADIFKYPDDKCKTCLVLVGLTGAGKSILGHSIISKIIGEAHSASTNSVESITKSFNAGFSNKIFIQCDEAMNSRQKGMAARLKALITDPTQMIEPKGVDAYAVPLHTRFMFSSNDIEDAMYLSDGRGDRRYTVLHVSDVEKDNITGYWDVFGEWLEKEDTLPKILRYLLDLEYDRSKIKRPLQTEARNLMLQASWDPFDSWLASMLAQDFPIAEETHQKWYDAPTQMKNGKWEEKINREGWSTHVSMTALVTDYFAYCRKNRMHANQRLNEVQMSAALGKIAVKGKGGPCRIRVTEFDERKNSNVTKQVRLYPSLDKLKITMHLKSKYGYDAIDTDMLRLQENTNNTTQRTEPSPEPLNKDF